MSKELIPEPLSLDEQIDNQLVKANVTESVIAELRERYLPLRISGIEDKETYLLVKEGRKNCKAIRVMAKKICTDGREDAVAIQKKWVAKEKDVISRIAEVEDYLEAQEKEYEAQVAAEKEARKRKQEEQLITRMQTLNDMSALYADGSVILGEVSFELSAIKESDEDVWVETILPKYKEEYNKIQAEEIEKARLQQEREAELKRQQEELELERKHLKDEAERLQAEKERQEAEAKERKAAQLKSRREQLGALGFTYNGINGYCYYEYVILHCDVEEHCGADWDGLLDDAKKYVAEREKEEAEEKRKEQERVDLQNKRYAEMYPYKEFGSSVQVEALWCLSEDEYSSILLVKKSAYEHAEEEKKQKIADDAAKKERERIEEEQRQAELKRIVALGEVRSKILSQYTDKSEATIEGLGKMDDLAWEITRSGWQDVFEKEQLEKQEIIRKQEEERKAEELAQASDKTKWADMMKYLQELYIHDFKSGPYRKRAAILREKLEEIKAL